MRNYFFEERKAGVIAQLFRYFGAPVAHFLEYTEAVWWNENIG